jgi:hypothetical protein
VVNLPLEGRYLSQKSTVKWVLELGPSVFRESDKPQGFALEPKLFIIISTLKTAATRFSETSNIHQLTYRDKHRPTVKTLNQWYSNSRKLKSNLQVYFERLEGLGESGGRAPCILDLGTRWKLVHILSSLSVYSRGTNPLPIGGSVIHRDWSECCGSSALVRTCSPYRSHFIDWAILVTISGPDNPEGKQQSRLVALFLWAKSRGFASRSKFPPVVFSDMAAVSPSSLQQKTTLTTPRSQDAWRPPTFLPTLPFATATEVDRLHLQYKSDTSDSVQSRLLRFYSWLIVMMISLVLETWSNDWFSLQKFLWLSSGSPHKCLCINLN